MLDPWEQRKIGTPWGKSHIAVDGTTHLGPAHPCATCDAMDAAPMPILDNGELDYRDRRYAEGALRSEAAIMAATAVGRNEQFNKSVFKLSGYVNAGSLSRDEVEVEMMAAGYLASALGDHPFTEREMRNTLASAFGGGATKGLRKGPPDDGQVQEVTAEELNGHKRTEAEEKADAHALAVSRRAYELRLADEARALWTAQRAKMAGQEPPTMVNLADMLAIPDEPAKYRLDGLWPVGGRVLLAAQYKAGKTSLVANLIRSLIDGDQFLGRWTPRTVDRLVLIDTELDERMLRSWLRDQGIRNTDAVNVICMRGRLVTFNLTDDRIRAQWAQRIAGAELVLLDCLRPCLDSLGLSEHNEAGQFLVAFDALCREASAAEALVVHHMGHGQERSRGDSRLLDWPDVLWKIVRDTDDDGNDIEDGDRFFSALGRDVNVRESQLDWTPETRSLMVCGGGRVDKKARTAITDIAEILSDPAHADGLSHRQLVAKLKGYGVGRNLARAALVAAVERGAVLVVSGPRNSNLHILNPSYRQGD